MGGWLATRRPDAPPGRRSTCLPLRAIRRFSRAAPRRHDRRLRLRARRHRYPAPPAPRRRARPARQRRPQPRHGRSPAPGLLRPGRGRIRRGARHPRWAAATAPRRPGREPARRPADRGTAGHRLGAPRRGARRGRGELDSPVAQPRHGRAAVQPGRCLGGRRRRVGRGNHGAGHRRARSGRARQTSAALRRRAAARPTPGGSVVVAFAVQTLQTGRPGVAALSALHGPFTAVREATLPVRYRGTAVETVALDSAQALAADLAHWIGEGTAASTRPTDGMPPAPPQERRLEDAYPATPAGRLAEAQDVVAALVERYGVSGDEGPVRDAVAGMLPAWAKPTTDSAGNLWLKVGTGDPLVVFVAHLDEIGYRVDSIRADGTLALSVRGGFFPSLFEGQAALVHTPRGDVPGVFLPRDTTMGTTHQPRFVSASVGAASAEAAAALGVAPGQSVTMPKSYARLAGTRATGRSFDDRVGAASL